MEIFVVIKAALQSGGEYTLVSTEKAFSDKAKAEEYIKTLPTVWVEKINGLDFYCERAIHIVELDKV